MVLSTPIHDCIELAKQAWLTGHGQTFADLFAADGEFVVPGQKWQGRAAILDAFQEFAATHRVTHINIRNLVVQSDRAMLEWYWEEVDRRSGEISRAEDAIAIDFQEQQIQRWREYIDSNSLSG
jgi:uncharacterized protein (TIGR02246 family)